MDKTTKQSGINDYDMVELNPSNLNKQTLNHYYKHIADVQITEKSYAITKHALQKNVSVLLLYSDCLISQSSLIDVVLPAIEKVLNSVNQLDAQSLEQKLSMNWQLLASKDEPITLHRLSSILFEGNLIVFIEQAQVLFAITVPTVPQRQPTDAPSETPIRGARDGLVEDVSQNLALIRKRLRTVHLVCKTYTIGHFTNTKVVLLYLDNKIKEQVRLTIEERIEGIDVESLLTIGDLEQLISEKQYFSFPVVDHSGRPDYLAQNLLEGRFVILTDNNPIAMIGPGKLTGFLRSPEDKYFPVLATNFGILIRVFGLLLTIFLPAFYIAVTTFHPDQIPFQLLATIGNSRVGLPFEATIELFLIMCFMEVFREATFRMPGSISQAITVVGGLIIGDASINAGLVSPIIIVVAALTIVSGATLVNQTLASTAVLLRLIVYIVSAVLGMFGFILSFFLLVALLSKIKSFGAPYILNLEPNNWRKLLKTFFQVPLAWLPSTRKEDKQKEN